MMFACKNVVPLKIRVIVGDDYVIDYTTDYFKCFASQAWEVYTHGINIV